MKMKSYRGKIECLITKLLSSGNTNMYFLNKEIERVKSSLYPVYFFEIGDDVEQVKSEDLLNNL